MIPYIPQPELNLGPVTLHAFGVLVALAILLGMRIVQRRAVREGLNPDLSARLVAWVVAGGLLGAHLMDRLIYFPSQTLADPWSVLRIWEGLSSFGGFLGGTIAAVLCLRRMRLTQQDRWQYLDAIAYALPFAWVLGRLGCFLAFDHPGIATTFFLGERYVDGVVRHNLGLEEALYTIPVASLFLILGRRPRAPGFFTGLLAVVYAPFRFFLDFLRIVDARYFGLTPGQYGAIVLLAVGLWILLRASRARTTGSDARLRRSSDRSEGADSTTGFRDLELESCAKIGFHALDASPGPLRRNMPLRWNR